MTSAQQAYEWIKTGHWSLREFKEWLEQAQPLTDEEIHDCFQQRSKNKVTERRLITRAIEAAHGIK